MGCEKKRGLNKFNYLAMNLLYSDGEGVLPSPFTTITFDTVKILLRFKAAIIILPQILYAQPVL